MEYLFSPLQAFMQVNRSLDVDAGITQCTPTSQKNVCGQTH